MTDEFTAQHAIVVAYSFCLHQARIDTDAITAIRGGTRDVRRN